MEILSKPTNLSISQANDPEAEQMTQILSDPSLSEEEMKKAQDELMKVYHENQVAKKKAQIDSL